MDLIAAVFTMGAMAAAVGMIVHTSRTQWAQVAAKHGLKRWGFWFEGVRISGQLAGHRLELKKTDRRLLATLSDVALPDLALRPQTVIESALQLATATPDVQLGIRALDSDGSSKARGPHCSPSSAHRCARPQPRHRSSSRWWTGP